MDKIEVSDELKKTIGQNIRRLREGKGLSPEEAAGALGVEVASLQEIESGATAPSARILVNLCDLFSAPMDAILKGPEFTGEGA